MPTDVPTREERLAHASFLRCSCPLPPDFLPGNEHFVTNGGSRSMDPDIWMVLTEEEQAEYLACSVRAAGQRSADLVPCPMPGCAGLAVASTGTWIMMYWWREVQAIVKYLIYVFAVPGLKHS